MNERPLLDISINEIRVVNPRTRNKLHFDAIVSSISAVGLKKPITVSRRDRSEDGTQYDLVCGQGRMEAMLSLGQTTIPANVIEASQEDRFVMSLVENIARRPPSKRDLLREVSCLKSRGYDPKEIALKLGRDVGYICAIDRLMQKNEADLVEAVEANRIPLSIALLIASAKEPEIQRALSEAYESGELRGRRFKAAKRVIANHSAHLNMAKANPQDPGLTGRELVKEYERRTREQQALIKRAACVREKLLLLKSVMKILLGDDNFLTLLRAENLERIPAGLASNGEQG